MPKFIPSVISATYNAVTKLNQNFTAIATALENTLSRNGSAPNAMGASLDMNGHRVQNVADADSSDDAVNLGQAIALVASTAKGEKGNPGGTFQYPGTAADIAGLEIPVGINRFTTDDGGPWHVGVGRTDADVAAHPNAVAKSENGRYFQRDINFLTFEQFNPNALNGNTAMDELLSYLRLIGDAAPLYNTPKVNFGPFSYNMTASVHLKQKVHFIGTGMGLELAQINPGTRFTFPPGMTGFSVNRHNTLGSANVSDSGTAYGSIIEGFTVYGSGYADPGTAQEAGSGFYIRAQCQLIRCVGHYFARHGCAIVANENGDARGDVNQTLIIDCSWMHNRDHGIRIDGNNANACKIDGGTRGFNGGYGISYGTKEFGGPVNISIIGGHEVGNGKKSNAGQVATSAVWLNNNTYYANPLNIAGASTNSPDPAGVDNIWWYCTEVGTAADGPYPDIPLWQSGIAVRAGGAMESHGNGVGWLSPYTEGRQGPPFAKNVAFVLGAHGAGVRGGPFYGVPA